MIRLIALIVIALFGADAACRASEVPSDASKIVPLPVGSAMPAVVVRNADGTDRHLGPGPLARPTVLIFYRGGWCPYCNRHLGELKTIEPDLLKLGYEFLFLSADKPALLYSSLKEPDIHYTLLSDAKMQAARAYHIAFRVDAKGLEQYRQYGIDLEAASGEKHHELPVPAVFIIDSAGIIRFVYANPDYTTRLSAPQILDAARKIVAVRQPGVH